MNLQIPFKKEIEICDEDIIDMSDLSFDSDNKLLMSFIYIRNCGIKNKLDFTKCDYKDKESFLKLYLAKNIIFYSEQLIDTWRDIILNEYNNNLLSKKELIKFNEDNKEFIDNIKLFINSLALYKCVKMNDFYNKSIGMNFKHNSINSLCVGNICNILTKYDYIFISIIDDNYEYFDELFTDRNAYYLNEIINNHTPYNELFSALYSIL